VQKSHDVLGSCIFSHQKKVLSFLFWGERIQFSTGILFFMLGEVPSIEKPKGLNIKQNKLTKVLVLPKAFVNDRISNVSFHEI
jgi:hypothetical protein